MKLRILVASLTALCLLAVSFVPSFGRTSPYETPKDVPTAHPWQDDNQFTDQDDSAPYMIPIGPIIVTINLPVKWFSGFTAKPQPTVAKPQFSRTARPMSSDKKGDLR